MSTTSLAFDMGAEGNMDQGVTAYATYAQHYTGGATENKEDKNLYKQVIRLL
jgi:hypothetical protein